MVRSRAKVICATNANGRRTPGLKVAPKTFTIMYYAELGKPYMLLINMRYPTARGRNGIEGRRNGY